MRVPGELTFLCLIMFFVSSMPAHPLLNSIGALSCGVMALITKLNVGRGKKHLISGKAGGVLDVI